MGEFEVTCATRDQNGSITKLGLKGEGHMFVETIIADLRFSKVNTYYITRNNKRMEIRAKPNLTGERWFLVITDAEDKDGEGSDDLSFLVECT